MNTRVWIYSTVFNSEINFYWPNYWKEGRSCIPFLICKTTFKSSMIYLFPLGRFCLIRLSISMMLDINSTVLKTGCLLKSVYPTNISFSYSIYCSEISKYDFTYLHILVIGKIKCRVKSQAGGGWSRVVEKHHTTIWRRRYDV